MKVGKGRPGSRCRKFGVVLVQEGGERCREAESIERWGDVQGGFQKCREVSRSARVGKLRGWRGCRQKCREVGNSAGRREAYGWQRSLAGCRNRKEAVNKAAQAPLVPMGAGLGHGLGSPQGRMGPRQLPTGKKVLECRAEPLTYTLWERRGRDRQRRWGRGVGGDKERQRSRENRQERAGAGVSKAALGSPSIPPGLSQTPTHRLS